MYMVRRPINTIEKNLGDRIASGFSQRFIYSIVYDGYIPKGP